MESNLLSVFMMTYNHEKFIRQAVESILIQKTDFNFEIVIGEDKSTDSTRAILLEYARAFPDKLKLILHEENVGAANNQRAVLNACTAKYVAMCEGDDYWTDSLKLQKQVDFLEANPDFTICFHNITVIYEDESRQPHLLHENKFLEITTFEDLARENYIPTASCVFRNDLAATLPEWYFTMPLGDWILHLFNAERGKIKYFDEVMAVYRVHENGAWGNQPIAKRLSNVVMVVERCREHFYPRGKREFTETLKDTYKQLSVALFPIFESGDYENFRRYYYMIAGNATNIPARTFVALTIRYLFSYLHNLKGSSKEQR